MKLIDLTYRYVDEYKIGKINYNPIVEKKMNWKKIIGDIYLKLKSLNKEFYLKKDLIRYF